MHRNHSVIFAFLGCALAVFGGVLPDSMFGDHMVLQRQMQVPVWGKASPGERINVTFGDQSIEGIAGEDGGWMVKLSPMEANASPQELIISGKDSRYIFKDILVGEVWLCSGQSNMGVSLRECCEEPHYNEIQKIYDEWDNPPIRHIGTWAEWSSFPREARPSVWEVICPPLDRYSAICFLFASQLYEKLQIPIGIISSHWGGTRLEPWVPPCGFDSVPELADISKAVHDKLDAHICHEEHVKLYENWRDYCAKMKADGKAPGFPPECAPEPAMWENRDNPTVLYNVMIRKYVPYAFRGVVWYQGESNLGDGALYKQKLQALFNGWKQVFDNPEMIFYVVQLAPYIYYGANGGELPVIWEAQEAFCKEHEPQTGLVVINDVGNLHDVHPRHKKPVGDRLANMALERVYGFNGINAEFPRPVSCNFDEKSCRISFEHVSKWSIPKGKAEHFQLAGEDGVFHSAEISIDKTNIIVTSPEVAVPCQVRYMWNQENEASLFNEAGLPMGAFRFSK